MNSENYKGIFGLIGIWSTWLIGHAATLQAWASILASVGAFIASIVYAIYYLRKLRKEK